MALDNLREKLMQPDSFESVSLLIMLSRKVKNVSDELSSIITKIFNRSDLIRLFQCEQYNISKSWINFLLNCYLVLLVQKLTVQIGGRHGIK